MILYGIYLVPLAEDLRSSDLRLLSTFYTNDAAFYRSEQTSEKILNMLMEKGTYMGYFPNPAKTLFISNMPEQEDTAKREYAAEGIESNFTGGSWYLGAYLSPREEFEAWVKPQMEAWSQGVKVSSKTAKKHPQSIYSGLRMLLQLKCQYLQSNVPGVGTLMGTI